MRSCCCWCSRSGREGPRRSSPQRTCVATFAFWGTGSCAPLTRVRRPSGAAPSLGGSARGSASAVRVGGRASAHCAHLPFAHSHNHRIASRALFACARREGSKLHVSYNDVVGQSSERMQVSDRLYLAVSNGRTGTGTGPQLIASAHVHCARAVHCTAHRTHTHRAVHRARCACAKRRPPFKLPAHAAAATRAHSLTIFVSFQSFRSRTSLPVPCGRSALPRCRCRCVPVLELIAPLCCALLYLRSRSLVKTSAAAPGRRLLGSLPASRSALRPALVLWLYVSARPPRPTHKARLPQPGRSALDPSPRLSPSVFLASQSSQPVHSHRPRSLPLSVHSIFQPAPAPPA